MTPFEEKEIRGITGRLLKGVVWQTAILSGMACIFYFTLKSDIKNLYTLREEGQKYWELKFEQIQIQNNLLSKQVDEINIRLIRLQEDQIKENYTTPK
jgi:hypothetical protein